jgi:hypothetical protein
MKAMREDYAMHAVAPRAIAHEHLDSGRVANRVLAATGTGGA